MTLNELLAHAVRSKASDVHLAAGVKPVLRIDGELTPVDLPPVANEVLTGLLDILTPGQRAEFDEERDVDLSVEIEHVGRFRLNILQEQSGIGAAFRLIPAAVPSFDLLGLPPVLRELCRLDCTTCASASAFLGPGTRGTSRFARRSPNR